MRPALTSFVVLLFVSLSIVGCSSEETVISESKFNLGSNRIDDTLTITITALNAIKYGSTNPNVITPLKSRQHLYSYRRPYPRARPSST